jgi:anti-sigma B factor antagonist
MMPTDFSIEIDRHGDHAVLVIAGELDLRTRDQLSDLAMRTLHDAETVIADLARVTFVDSSGLSALVAARQEATRLERQFRVRSAQGPVARLLEISGLGHWLTGEGP